MKGMLLRKPGDVIEDAGEANHLVRKLPSLFPDSQDRPTVLHSWGISLLLSKKEAKLR